MRPLCGGGRTLVSEDILPDGRMVFIEPGAGSELVLVFDWSPARH